MKNRSRLDEPIVFVPLGIKEEITEEEKKKATEAIEKLKKRQDHDSETCIKKKNTKSD